VPPARQPVVLFGGFASTAHVYAGMERALIALGQPTEVVATHPLQWLLGLVPAGWLGPLETLHRTVRRAVQRSATGKVTLVGHSAGGVLARLYLAPEPFVGRTFAGVTHIGHLITLGSPHYNRQRWLHGGMMSRWIELRYPGAYFSGQVRYTCVAGKLRRGDPSGSLRDRHAYAFYRRICGEGRVWGDGLVPLRSALLDGAVHIRVDGVAHFAGYGEQWYGSPAVVAQWWARAQTGKGPYMDPVRREQG
jgi:pimeloyl-ACP methyl ester carboxylesterase